MKTWQAFLIVGALTAGCSSTPVELPDCQIPASTEAAQAALDLPALPGEVSSTDTTATFDVAGMQQLKRYRIASEANKTIADENALALDARNRSVEALLECSRNQRQFAVIREELLQQERKDRFIDNLWHRGLIVVIAIGIAL